MELLDKFNFAVDALDYSSNDFTADSQEEIIFSSISESNAYSINEDEFKELGDALEAHFHHVCASIAIKVDFNLTNRFSRNVRYRETYSYILKNLTLVKNYIHSSFQNRGEVRVELTSDQVKIKISNLLLEENEDERAILFRVKNNRFFNAKISSYRRGMRKLYEVTLTGSWSLQDSKENKKTYRSQDGARKSRWENTL